MDQMKVVVFYASEISIPATNESNAVNGTSIEYFFFGENGELFEPKPVGIKDTDIGLRRGKAFLDYTVFRDKLLMVPGIYDGTFEMQVGNNGKPTLRLVNLNFVQSVKMVPEGNPVTKEGK